MNNKLKSKKLINALVISGSLMYLTGCFNEDNKVSTETTAIQLSELKSVANNMSAHWLKSDILVVPNTTSNLSHTLISVGNSQQKTSKLIPVSFPEELKSQFPHLADYQAFKTDLSSKEAKMWLKNELIFASYSKDSTQLDSATYVQTSALIDDLYTSGENDANEVNDLGATISEKGISLKLWAPTAQKVEVLIFDQDLKPSVPRSTLLTEDSNTGVWSTTLDASLNEAFYQYKISVYHPENKKVETLITTDPYSLSLSTNSQYSQIIDLNNEDTKPEGWNEHIVPTLKNDEDHIIYETHIRDFSASDKALADKTLKGKYKAFSDLNSDGMKHLVSLREAGLTTIQLLPAFDFGTVNENKQQVIDIEDSLSDICSNHETLSFCANLANNSMTLKDLLSTFDSSTSQAQAIVSEVRQLDNFNWGYDPFHYTVPEGSYATESHGKTRVIEFREMVQSLHSLGFRVIMDVVYNHTHQFGLNENSVLDKIVPNYYHRLDPITGIVEQSTCYTCGNTATERVMMSKLMTDSLKTWSKDYKVDGFRFDLMGHQPKSSMLVAREAVREIDPDTYFYGEGWNFGEVANNSQFEQASQLNLGGTEIGTFSDRLRDAVRGPGNNTRQTQGIGNGLLFQPNEMQSEKENKAQYQLLLNQLKVGLAGNLKHYPITNVDGTKLLGKDIPYGGQPTGYALDPADTINYVSKHDNQTLWDNSQYRLPFETTTQNRVRMHIQSISFALFAQGIPFLHMSSEFMRSKSFLRDSYDYGDWFNKVDFTKQTNNYNAGLPPADKDEDNWPLITKVITGHNGKDAVSPNDIELSSSVFKEMLAIRSSTPLFRLSNADEILDKISFIDGVSETNESGIFAMKIDDTIGSKVDEQISTLVVVFNLTSSTKVLNYENTNGFTLHPIQLNGSDNIVKLSTFSSDGFSVPALTTAVFVKK